MKIKLLVGLLAALCIQPAVAAKTCVLVGDSIMSEVYPTTMNGPYGKAMELAANRIQQEADVIIKNISVPANSLGGDTFSFANGTEVLQGIGGAYSYYNCVIIQAGTNDFGKSVPLDKTVAALNSLLTEATRANKKVLLMDAIWRRNENTPNSLGLTLGSYRWALAVECNNHPGVCHFASRTGTVFDSASASPLYTASEIEGVRELHLNAEGHRRYADLVLMKALYYGIF